MALYAAIGIAYGGNTTSQQFNLPDLRGRFLRGWDHGAGNDPGAAGRTSTAVGGNTGDAVGSLELDAFASHTHGVNDPGHAHSLGIQNWAFSPGGSEYAFGTSGTINNNPPTNSATTGITLASTGDQETRPVNVTVNYIIKL